MFSVEIRVNTELVCYAFGRRLQSPLDPDERREYRVEFYNPDTGHTYTVELEHKPADGLLALVHAALGRVLEQRRDGAAPQRGAKRKAVAQTESKRTQKGVRKR